MIDASADYALYVVGGKLGFNPSRSLNEKIIVNRRVFSRS